MGHHDADPAEHRRYTGVVLLSVLVLAMLTVAALAKTEVSNLEGGQVRQPAVGNLLPSAALDDDGDSDDDGACLGESVDGCEHRAAGRRGVLDGEDAPPGDVRTFDPALQAMGLLALADHEGIKLAAAR